MVSNQVTYLSYLPENSLNGLANLCISLLNKNKSIAVVVQEVRQILLISNFFWKFYKFLPHGIFGEEFATIQPILIITNENEHKLIPRQVIICFELIDEKFLQYGAEFLIIWNKEAAGSTIRREKDGLWH